jgi:MFS family permease
VGTVNRLGVALLTVSHAVDDLYQGAVPALPPFFVAERHYSYAAASGLILAGNLFASITQPAFGAITDKLRLGWLVGAGMSVAGIGVGLSGLSSSYQLTWLAIALSGLGVAAFHPEAARSARIASAGRQTAMSWFAVGGNLGLTLGPLLVTPVLLGRPWIFLFIALTAVTTYLPFAIQVTLGQDYLPNRVGTASGVSLGLAITIGGLLSPGARRPRRRHQPAPHPDGAHRAAGAGAGDQHDPARPAPLAAGGRARRAVIGPHLSGAYRWVDSSSASWVMSNRTWAMMIGHSRLVLW